MIANLAFPAHRLDRLDRLAGTLALPDATLISQSIEKVEEPSYRSYLL
jgi:hypothetical protein